MAVSKVVRTVLDIVGAWTIVGGIIVAAKSKKDRLSYFGELGSIYNDDYRRDLRCKTCRDVNGEFFKNQ